MIRCGSVATLIFTLMSASFWPSALPAQDAERNKSMSNNITIRIGDKAFSATLSENPTAAAFKKLLPLSTTMTELNGNEKFARLSGTMPVQASTPSSIQAGDLMLYGSSTVVLFYKSFSTTYSSTKIGRIDDPTGLQVALGSGHVAVTFEAPLRR
jgi:hypothetical protein